MKNNDFNRGIWCAIETMTRGYNESAVRELIKMSGFTREECLQFASETGMDVNETMKVIDDEMKWSKK